MKKVNSIYASLIAVALTAMLSSVPVTAEADHNARNCGSWFDCYWYDSYDYNRP